MKILRRLVLVILCIVLIAGAIAPRLSTERIRPRIQSALEAALNRRVQIGAVHLNLFRGPGFTVERVVIADDPSAGIEPFAYVESMRARVRLTGRMQKKRRFDSISRRPRIRGTPDIITHHEIADGRKGSCILGRFKKTVKPLQVLGCNVEVGFRSEVHPGNDLLADCAVVPRHNRQADRCRGELRT